MIICSVLIVSAEGRVENQKLNKTAALLSFGWVFGFQLDSLEKNVLTLVAVTFIFVQISIYKKGARRSSIQIWDIN